MVVNLPFDPSHAGVVREEVRWRFQSLAGLEPDATAPDVRAIVAALPVPAERHAHIETGAHLG